MIGHENERGKGWMMGTGKGVCQWVHCTALHRTALRHQVHLEFRLKKPTYTTTHLKAQLTLRLQVEGEGGRGTGKGGVHVSFPEGGV